ncbi:hypothetical protein L1D44_09640 [Shewanella sp. Isolate13]|uniref:hypothetical protein n=1 Tax=Shewanella sp. Isolate13 TaxID=2908531 RepID=UPI001EFD30DD|nr:hypothetical protein [Shewanella sp. Isolate13]MCG9730112.1 hypothetical protein [Shewanella sp. Isolate13]
MKKVKSTASSSINSTESTASPESTAQSQPVVQSEQVRHAWHFALTLLTFGVWGLVWWWLILRAEKKQIFSGFDDAYWSYLIERDQPPAALHRMHFSKNEKNSKFEA